MKRNSNCKLKVVVINPQRIMSGGEICLYRVMTNNDYIDPVFISPAGVFSDFLVENGHSCTTINDIARTGRNLGGSWLLTFLKSYIKSILKIVKVIRNESPDLVFGNGRFGLIYGILPSIITRRALFWTHYDYLDQRLDNTVISCLSLFAKRSIAVSTPIKKRLENFLTKRKTIVIYNGLDFEKVDLSKSKSNRSEIVIGIIGRLIPRKGHELLLNAISIVNKKQLSDDFRVVIIGSEDNEQGLKYRNALEQIVLDKGLENKVEFLGQINDFHSMYGKIDICVNPSLSPEPLGTTLYEAMALGKIVVASNSGGSPEIIVDKQTGFLFTSGNKEELASILINIISNFHSSEMKQMAEQGMDRARAVFDNEKTQENYYRTFLEAI